MALIPQRGLPGWPTCASRAMADPRSLRLPARSGVWTEHFPAANHSWPARGSQVQDLGDSPGIGAKRVKLVTNPKYASTRAECYEELMSRSVDRLRERRCGISHARVGRQTVQTGTNQWVNDTSVLGGRRNASATCHKSAVSPPNRQNAVPAK